VILSQLATLTNLEVISEVDPQNNSNNNNNNNNNNNKQKKIASKQNLQYSSLS
jgi:hypothetical protein